MDNLNIPFSEALWMSLAWALACLYWHCFHAQCSALMFSGLWPTYKDDGVVVHCKGKASIRTGKVKIQAPMESTHLLPPTIETAFGKQPLWATVSHPDQLQQKGDISAPPYVSSVCPWRRHNREPWSRRQLWCYCMEVHICPQHSRTKLLLTWAEACKGRSPTNRARR